VNFSFVFPNPYRDLSRWRSVLGNLNDRRCERIDGTLDFVWHTSNRGTELRRCIGVCDQLLQRRFQTFSAERFRERIEVQSAEMVQHRAQAPVSLKDDPLVARRDIANHELELDENADEALLGPVVKITLDASPFRIVVCDDPALGSVKVSQPRSGSCGKLGVAKGQFDGWREVGQQLRLVSAGQRRQPHDWP
jgi:hypothetical protein